MSAKDKERVKELERVLQCSKVYAFSCSVCVLLARPGDCKECPVYGAR